MDIKNIGYNIGVIDIDTALTSGTPAEIGTLDDLKKIYNIAKNSAIARINYSLGGVAMSGACFLNPFVDANGIGVDVGAVTNFGGSPSLISGTFYTSSGKMYGVVTLTPVSTTAKTATKTASK